MILEVRDVTVRFGGIVACSDVSFVQNRHEFLALIGPNGAGKTTLLNVIFGVYRPESGGSVIFLGDETTPQELIGKRPDQIAELGLSRTLQNLGLFKGLTVFENLLAGRQVHAKSSVLATALRLPGARQEEIEQREKADAYLDILGLREVADEPVEVQPYGYQKRVELGRALLMEPELLLLDEPFAGMSGPEKSEMSELLTRLRRETSVTFLMIEHDMDVVMRMADRIVVLDQGAVIAEGTPEEVQRDAGVIEAYLGAD